jgi:4-hydroxy-tetrahydrodipicolinate synthase
VSGPPFSASGCLTALPTPFQRGAVDLASLRRLVRAQVEAGVSGFCPCGTTGESPTLSEDEVRAVVEATVSEASGTLVAAGAGSPDTRHAVALVRAAKKAGAAAALAVTPYYNRPSQEGLYRHFRAMWEDGGLPLLLYHIPSRTGVSIEVDTIARLYETGGVIGLKEADSGIDRVSRIRAACPVAILSGDDAKTAAMIALGAVGVVSVASNVAPRQVVSLVDAAVAGRRDDALLAHERLLPLVSALFAESNPVPVKAALRLLGLLESDEVRLPLVSASESTVRGLRAALDALR